MKSFSIICFIGALATLNLASLPAHALERGKPVHAFSYHGVPKHGPEYQHFDFVNPDAPKGGTLRLMGFGTYDSFNPFIVKGDPAAGMSFRGSASFFYESLMTDGLNEPATNYCHICETVEIAEDNTWTEFVLRPEAKFHDGTPITPEDVIFSFNTLMEKGIPNYRLYWGDVESVEKTGDRSVRFNFSTDTNFELPSILGQLTVLPKAYWEGREFTESTLEPPVASGPYRIESFEPGRYIVYKRIDDYWAEDLPVKRGIHNFDEIRFDYYLDMEVAMEAFNAGEYDYKAENSSARWATAYREDLVESGQVIRLVSRDGNPNRGQWFVPNLRRAKFADRDVRRALTLAFDFAWTNRTIAYSSFIPTDSFFGGSDLGWSGLPGDDELEVLEPFRGQIPDEVFTQEYVPTQTDGSGNIRDNLIEANGLLTGAGWVERDGKRVNEETGEEFTIEFLIAQENLSQWINPFIRNLERLGIQGTVRVVDSAQFINRMSEYDFDMMITGWGQSLVPGNEQREFWGSDAADRTGSRNYAGIKDPAVDEIIEKLIVAKTRDELIAHTRALDRVLLWNFYTLPMLTLDVDWIAYWNKFGLPDVTPLQGPIVITWWYDEAKAQALASGAPASADSGDMAGSEDAAEQAQEPQGDNTIIIISIAIVGVVLLLWSSMRRRHRK